MRVRAAALVMSSLVAGLLLIEPGRLSNAVAQVPILQDERFAGLQWTFVRIRYSAFTVDSRYRVDYWGEPWAIDAPAAEQNLSRRLRTATAIQVNDPIVLTLEDPKLWDHAWIYMVEPGNLRLRDSEVSILREFLLRGGTVTFDDFHGPYEWDNFANEMKRVFPDREPVDLAPPHPESPAHRRAPPVKAVVLPPREAPFPALPASCLAESRFSPPRSHRPHPSV